MNTKCLKKIDNALYTESPKEVCRHLDEIAECTVQMVKKACGEEVMTFFKSLYEPAIELHRGICEDVILPENEDTFTTKRFEKTSLPSFYGPLEFIL
ncbi:uncharacterized protein CEXT_624721 [Caerostris extrusa]|uniref:Uncharacterized protein n=1 Tax=Caerostris extrusa TaxID=172846 RepID=A0AAV4TNW9_CAEEX|nr:uncharacterized protein CEXT_624721 [Caerostris extrusa]